jgi:hypothetical protein
MLQWIPSAISIVSLLIALFSAFLACQTYLVSHRPYIGIFESHIKVNSDEKGEPVGMSWVFITKNTESVPALANIEKNLCTLRQGQRALALPKIERQKDSLLLMSNQVGHLPGKYLNDFAGIKIRDILAGKILLTCDIEVSYTTIGWRWKSTFVYQGSFRLQADYSVFIMDSGFAN